MPYRSAAENVAIKRHVFVVKTLGAWARERALQFTELYTVVLNTKTKACGVRERVGFLGFRRFVRGAGCEKGTDVWYDVISRRRNQRAGATSAVILPTHNCVFAEPLFVSWPRDMK
jgi:hypothetical protein